MARPSRKTLLESVSSASVSAPTADGTSLPNEPVTFDVFRADMIERGNQIRLGQNAVSEKIADCMNRFASAAANGTFDVAKQLDSLWAEWKFGTAQGAIPAKLTTSHTSERARLRTFCAAAVKGKGVVEMPKVVEKARAAFEAVRDTAKTDKNAPKAVQYENGLAQIGTYIAEHGNITDDIIRQKMTVKTTTTTTTTANPVIAAIDAVLASIDALLKIDAPAEMKAKLRLARAEVDNMADPLRKPVAPVATDGATAPSA